MLSNLSKVSINLVSKRYRKQPSLKSWPNDWVPFHWSRPEKVAGYFDKGDLHGLVDPDETELHPDFRLSTELKSLDAKDPARRLFSLEHSSRKQQSELDAQKYINNLGIIHYVDYPNSLEAKIARLTFSARHVQDIVRNQGGETRYNQTARTLANNIATRRNRYLYELKELHRDRYERLLKDLDIELKSNKIGVVEPRPFRKIQMRILSEDYSSSIKEERVRKYKETLEDMKAEFDSYKREALKWIEENEAKLGMKVE